MNALDSLALIAIGIGFGLALALVAVMVYGLYTANVQSRRDTAASHKAVADWLQKNVAAMEALRMEVTTALSRLDAERLHAASAALQRSVKTFVGEVDKLQKIVYAQPAPPALDFTDTGFSLDNEAEDDARMMAERFRWQGQAVDPLDGLSEEEKAARVSQYFERRRQGTTTSAPPSPFSGAYASLREAAHAPSPSAPADFSGTEQGVELTEKGELE